MGAGRLRATDPALRQRLSGEGGRGDPPPAPRVILAARAARSVHPRHERRLPLHAEQDDRAGVVRDAEHEHLRLDPGDATRLVSSSLASAALAPIAAAIGPIPRDVMNARRSA